MKKQTHRIMATVVTTALVWGGITPAWAADEKSAEKRPLVQIAVLLDTSGSMQGMINQAKAQLWSIVNEFATAERGGQKPILQVALYHYGTPSLGKDTGYVRQLEPLTEDLDSISEKLFALRTNGGDEYCGWVIQAATRKLKWSENAKDYKAIFIAGNESFGQGEVDYKLACKDAISAGIIVNTIHCAGGASDGWADGARLADGRFMRIDGNQKVVEVEAPQDEILVKLNVKLNTTYIAYGSRGAEKSKRQAKVDRFSWGISRANLSSRARSKASAQYRNTDWDLVDAVREKTVELKKVKDKDLPEEMRKMSLEEREAHVQKKQKERLAIQKEIRVLSKERDKYVAEKRRETVESNKNTLGDKVRQAVRAQAETRGFNFK